MKVFISWSGQRSRELANAIRDWLPLVLHYVTPFVSDKDISAGDRWAQKIADELEHSNFGIICITPENLSSEWILFESGALSKSMLDGKVIPLLFDVELSDLSGPLSQFQAQKIEEVGVMEVVHAINAIAQNKAETKVVDRLIPALWPQLEDALSKIPDIAPTERHQRPTNEILEEIVTDVRGINSHMRNLNTDSEGSTKGSKLFNKNFYSFFLEELLHLAPTENPGLPLLVLASIIRDETPWIAELLMETYREIQNPNKNERQIVLMRLRNSLEFFAKNPLMRQLNHSDEVSYLLLKQLPIAVEKLALDE